ncbi:hypothetical protein SAMN02745216_02677 [Desulfatibacillum alkenivorans DSM 16219]|jgi:hypothetical protein|uniref:ARG and Rhodanese-Phosphatase-superfamily-associated domain-containing protein n=1 Tax=Desulfatibacillum alkenivorans DSM 16219 TaxID=1121393 RepID=A0A1M6NW97_9BACT|nr:DUF6569 family protein [Desulfatibacillum alkenivorans]SHJ99920.1 hypothetical protein SAMN02745216_02677 [Desulfatibacillum alkenivorans DSM 16219]
MNQVQDFLDAVKIAGKQTFQNMTVFPLLAPQNGDPGYLTLEEALAKGFVQVTEVDESGSVPELFLRNRGEVSILILEGEELVGAKQNRVVNATFLIPRKTELKLPVSCVEHGRWDYTSREFKTSDKVMHASLRRKSQQDVCLNMAAGRGFQSDQMKIWDDISGKAHRLKANAPTRAMSDVYESSKDLLEGYMQRFSLMECQVGAIFAINGKVLGLECFGYSDTFKRFFEKLLRSYALDAIDMKEGAASKPMRPEKAHDFFNSVMESTPHAHGSVGSGMFYRIDSWTISGAALLEQGQVLHLSAFQKEEPGESPRVGFQRFSQRRR